MDGSASFNLFPLSKLDFSQSNFVNNTGAAALLRRRVIDSRRFHPSLLLGAAVEKFCHLDHLPILKDIWHKKIQQFKGNSMLLLSHDTSSSTSPSCLCFCNGEGSTNYSSGIGPSSSNTTKRSSSSGGRKWTNVIIASNVLVYIINTIMHDKLLLWGAKANVLMDKGQVWRLITSSFLHATPVHLMVNCYSLNSLGFLETIFGPKRFLASYFTSAIASSAMSYRFNKADSVGASGAIFGLTGALTALILKRRKTGRGDKEQLVYIARALALNLVIGLLQKNIDNWGHLGGFLGGAAVSFLLDPALRR